MLVWKFLLLSPTSLFKYFKNKHAQSVTIFGKCVRLFLLLPQIQELVVHFHTLCMPSLEQGGYQSRERAPFPDSRNSTFIEITKNQVDFLRCQTGNDLNRLKIISSLTSACLLSTNDKHKIRYSIYHLFNAKPWSKYWPCLDSSTEWQCMWWRPLQIPMSGNNQAGFDLPKLALLLFLLLLYS